MLLLDWGGTLAPADPKGFFDQRDANGYALPPNVLDALGKLCANPSCHVMIMSGLPREKVTLTPTPTPNPTPTPTPTLTLTLTLTLTRC